MEKFQCYEKLFAELWQEYTENLEVEATPLHLTHKEKSETISTLRILIAIEHFKKGNALHIILISVCYFLAVTLSERDS